jgi:ketosteroid isomerase-like protein
LGSRGGRSLVLEALKPVGHLALVREAIDAIAAGDLDAVLGCLADDVVFEFPYAAGSQVLDRAGVRDVMAFVIRTFPTRRFQVDGVFELADPDGLIVEYSSEFATAGGDVHYANRYVAIFQFRDGLIRRWREYANPVPFERALAAVRAVVS